MNTEAIIAFARRDDGTIVAASTASPYFCFEAPDEDAAKRKVEAALAFYAEIKKKARETAQDTSANTETRLTVEPAVVYKSERMVHCGYAHTTISSERSTPRI